MSILGLPDALRAAGLSVHVVPEWRTNGHDGQLVLENPYGLLLHHTADNIGLKAVWCEGCPDVRPDVPEPRAHLWLPRSSAAVGYDVAVVTAGRAYQAGTNSSVVHEDIRAGRVSAATADAAARGLEDDMNGNPHLLGLEVENLGDGQPLTEEQLRDLPRICAAVLRLFGWSVGHLAHHRQVTRRKPDMAWRGDIWSMTDAVLRGDDDVSYDDVVRALRDVLRLPGGGLAVPVGQVDNGNLAKILVGMAQQEVNRDAAEAAQLRALVAQSSPAAVADAVVAKLPPASTGGLTRDDVAAAVRDVLGSLNDPPKQP